jgi:outer membrane cobalamin receptor
MVADSIKLVFAQMPFRTQVIAIKLHADTSINVILKDDTEFPNFRVTSKPDNQINYKPDEINLNGRTIKQFPVLFGETDVLKGLQLLPGVSSGNDGTVGLNIRGGGADQNLILLDDVPIYNPSHIFGFFSVFNSDIVKDVKLIKGGTSARYSGRLSSVIDVRSLDGNSRKLKVQASIGVLSSKLTLDGPIGKKKKTTFIISGRRSYIDLFSADAVTPFFSNKLTPLKTGYYFYDANGKINHRFSDKHQLSLSFYTGQDNLFIRNSFSIKNDQKEISEKDRQLVFWGNRVFSLRDHHVLTPKLSAWLNVSFTSYDFGNESSYEYTENSDTQQITDAFNYRFISRIQNRIISYNTDFKFRDWLNIKAGTGVVFHKFSRDITSSANVLTKKIEESSSNVINEYNAYLEFNWKIRRKLMINSGAHWVRYQLKDMNYLALQPRISINYKVRKHWLFHAAYQQNQQFLHLLTGTTAGVPIDLWLPSTAKVAPEKSKMVSGGISYTKGDYQLNVEAFNKSMFNLIEYKDQANYIDIDNNWEQKVTIGRGLAFGYEVLLEKRNGKTKGWTSYTLSWNQRQFDAINAGRIFPYRYDRRHNLAVFVSHEFNKKIDASMSWSYTSGANYTLPEQVYYLHSGLAPNNLIYIYGDRNNYQFPSYHRMDFGVNFKNTNKHFSRHLSIGAYNVYNRLNPFYIAPSYNEKGERVFEAISLFPFIPSINYKIVF